VIPAERTPVVVGAEARAWRRAVGPTAWVVLEEFVAIAQPDANGRWCAATSIRGLAAELGLGRDAVDAALRRLRLAAVVTFAPPRRPADGRFGAGSYVVSGEIRAALTDAPQPALRAVGRPVRRAVVAMEQLGLTFGDVSIEDTGAQGGRLAIDALGGDAEHREDGAGGGDAVGEELGGGGEGRGCRHELASTMRAGPGDVGGDVGGGGRPC
jgi:hypothetical protein